MLADALGTALQLTNILRDIAEDAERGRLYLPDDMLADHGITSQRPEDVLADPRLSKVAEEIGGLADEKFRQARAQLALCDGSKVRPAVMMAEAYERILRRIQERGWARILEPAGLSKAEKLWIAFRYGVF